MPLNPELIKLLACPTCKQPVILIDDDTGLACEACACVYPIKDDIPMMIIEKAILRAVWDDRQHNTGKN